MSNNIKAAIFLLIFIFLVIGVTSKVAAQVGIKPLGNMPTLSSCDCVQYEAVSFNGTTTYKIGTVTVYRDAVSFDFGTITTLVQVAQNLYVDKKENFWLEVTDDSGTRVFKNKKKRLYFSPIK